MGTNKRRLPILSLLANISTAEIEPYSYNPEQFKTPWEAIWKYEKWIRENRNASEEEKRDNQEFINNNDDLRILFESKMQNIEHIAETSQERLTYIKYLRLIRSEWSIELLCSMLPQTSLKMPEGMDVKTYAKHLYVSDLHAFKNSSLARQSLQKMDLYDAPVHESNAYGSFAPKEEWDEWWETYKDRLDEIVATPPGAKQLVSLASQQSTTIGPGESRPSQSSEANSSLSPKQRPSNSNYLWIPLLIAFILGGVFLKRKAS